MSRKGMSRNGIARRGMARLLFAIPAMLLEGIADAAELIMFEQPGCIYCRRWDTEIGPGYLKSSEGKLAPLSRLDIRAKVPDGITLKRPVTITPTFVLVDDGQEVGRVVGYGGAEFFYEMLADVMAKLPKGISAAGGMSAGEPRKSTP